jgi:hypothetical protein
LPQQEPARRDDGIATVSGEGSTGVVSPERISTAPDRRREQQIHATNPVTGEAIFVGAHSVPAMVVALGQASNNNNNSNPSAVQELLSKSTLPIFMLENDSLAYPFVDPWGLPHGSTERIEKLCGLLPSGADCLSYLQHYRDLQHYRGTAHVLFPGIVNLSQFEAEVARFQMLRNAAQAGQRNVRLSEKDVSGMDLHWLDLLFACLASGCQCSDRPRRERQLTSQVFGRLEIIEHKA